MPMIFMRLSTELPLVRESHLPRYPPHYLLVQPLDFASKHPREGHDLRDEREKISH